MDTVRQVRFLYPPVILWSYFAWVFLWDDVRREQFVTNFILAPQNSGGAIIVAALASGTGLIVTGFLLGTFTYLLLRGGSLIIGQLYGTEWQIHEAWFDAPTMTRILNLTLTRESERRPENIQPATVWLDFAILPERVHQWVERRWNAFNTSANIAVGIVIIWVVAPSCLGNRSVPPHWMCWGAIAFCGFTLNALLAWRDAMRLLRLGPDFRTEYTHNR